MSISFLYYYTIYLWLAQRKGFETTCFTSRLEAQQGFHSPKKGSAARIRFRARRAFWVILSYLFNLIHLELIHLKSMYSQSLFAVIVEAYACLSSKLAGSYHLLKQNVRSVLRITVFFVQGVHDSKAYIKSDKVT